MIQLSWQKLDQIFSTSCSSDNESLIKSALGQTVDKAVALLDKSIEDESVFLLFDWNKASGELGVFVTDENKQLDSKIVVRCVFSAVDQTDAFAEQIKFWIKDYLTTCNAFFHYSLVAVFCSGSRLDGDLL